MDTNHLINLFAKKSNRTFVEKNEKADVTKLLFKYSKDPDKRNLIEQIGIRQKLKKKLPEWYSQNGVIFPSGVSPEQSSSEVTAKIKAELFTGNKLIDITGGMGVDCFYMSSVFNSTTYVERAADLCRLSEYNFNILGAHTIRVENRDGIEALQNSDADFVYVDPARRGDNNQKLVSLTQCKPNVVEHVDLLCKGNRSCLIKASPMLDITRAIKDLKYVQRVFVISHKNECKELLIELNKKPVSEIKILTFNKLTNGAQDRFAFTFSEKAEISIADSIEAYLYEPNASVLKANGGDCLAREFDLCKLHPQTNLYTSQSLNTHFSGRVFKVINVLSPFDKSLRKRRFNVISRNFPDKADRIQQRLNLKSADKDYLIACKTSFNNLIFIEANQVDPF